MSNSWIVINRLFVGYRFTCNVLHFHSSIVCPDFFYSFEFLWIVSRPTAFICTIFLLQKTSKRNKNIVLDFSVYLTFSSFFFFFSFFYFVLMSCGFCECVRTSVYLWCQRRFYVFKFKENLIHITQSIETHRIVMLLFIIL